LLLFIPGTVDRLLDKPPAFTTVTFTDSLKTPVKLQMKKNTYIAVMTVWLVLSLSGCGTLWKTNVPDRSSLDQILISTAAERAAQSLTSDSAGQAVTNLAQSLGKSFIEAKNFKTSDELYALQVIRNSFLAAGVVLVDDVKNAQTVIEVAAGALSVDTSNSLVGIPAMAIPIPLAGNVQIPEMPLYKNATNRGLAKFAIALYDARTGKTKGKPFTAIGTATVDSWEVLLFFKFMTNDLQLPHQYKSLF
jgi:hypothetical protein